MSSTAGVGVKKCCVPECNVNSLFKIPLHLFPNPDRRPEKFLEWVNAIGGDIVALNPQYIYKNKRVCHQHFESKYYTWSNRLSYNAVPTLFCTEQISEADAQERAAGGAESALQRYKVLTDEEIVRAAMCEDVEQDEDNSVEVPASKKVGNSEAVGALNTALKWAEDNEFDSHEVMFLRRLRDRAFEMKCENDKQKSITDFFKKN